MRPKFEDFFDQIVITDFNRDAVEKLRKQVIEESIVDPAAPITIYIDSYGGEVDSLASVVEILTSVPNPIHTVCIGKAMSAGAILLAFGDKRYCGEYSTIMVHEFSGGAIGHLNDLMNEARQTKKMNEFWYGEMAKWCKLGDYRKFKLKMKQSGVRDLYFTASQAKDFGIVDHVGVPPVSLKTKVHKRKKRKARR